MQKKYYTQCANTAYNNSVYYGGLLTNTSHEKEFNTYEEAVAEARKTAAKTREDVVIYAIDSVVKFPVDDYKVEKVD